MSKENKGFEKKLQEFAITHKMACVSLYTSKTRR